MENITKCLALYLNFLQHTKRYSLKTVASYEIDIKDFLLYFDFVDTVGDFSALKSIDIQKYLHDQKLKNLNLSTIARRVSALKSFAKFLQKRCEMTNSNILAIKNIKVKKTVPRAIEENLFFRLTQSVKNQEKNDWEGLRNEAIAYLIYSTGMRISEALSISHTDLSRFDMITIHGKGNKERKIALHKSVLEVVSRYLKAMPDEIKIAMKGKIAMPLHKMPIFISKTGNKFTPRMFQLVMQKARMEIGLPNTVTPHALRHSFASHILQNGGDIKIIQEILGHKSLKTTQKYLSVSDVTLEKAYRKFHSGG